jgi:hypothetical protein
VEKLIKSFKELNIGDVVLVENPHYKTFTADGVNDVCVVSSIISVHKYPISENSGRKLYMKNRIPHYADEVGDTGNEMIKEFGITSSLMGEYTFNEDDEVVWNIRIIDENHPSYNHNLKNEGRMSGMFFNLLEKLEF